MGQCWNKESVEPISVYKLQLVNAEGDFVRLLAVYRTCAHCHHYYCQSEGHQECIVSINTPKERLTRIVGLTFHMYDWLEESSCHDEMGRYREVSAAPFDCLELM